MTAFTDTLGFNKNSAAFPAWGSHRFCYFDVTLDFAKIVAARSAASATALAAADTLQAVQLPAGTCILQGGCEVVSAETVNTTGTFDIGFTGGSPAAANVFANDVAINALSNTATGLAAPLTLASDDTLDILLNTAAPTDAVLRVWVIGVNVNKLDG